MIPQNEMGVIVIFTQQAQDAELEIISIQADYPDAIIKKGDRIYRVEFEYRSSNFLQHKHDPRGCDLIICWEDDYPNSTLPVIALSDPDWKMKDIILPDSYKAEIAYWKDRALKAENVILKRNRHKRITVNPPPKKEWRQVAISIVQVFPQISGAELARRLGASERTGQNILNELEQSGVIHRNGDGWKVSQ